MTDSCILCLLAWNIEVMAELQWLLCDYGMDLENGKEAELEVIILTLSGHSSLSGHWSLCQCYLQPSTVITQNNYK